MKNIIFGTAYKDCGRGAKANEVDYVEQVIEDECYEDVNYIFSFIGLSEQRDVKENDEKQERTDLFRSVYTGPLYLCRE